MKDKGAINLYFHIINHAPQMEKVPNPKAVFSIPTSQLSIPSNQPNSISNLAPPHLCVAMTIFNQNNNSNNSWVQIVIFVKTWRTLLNKIEVVNWELDLRWT